MVTLVVIMAIIMVLIGSVYVAMRFGRRYILIGPLCVALGVALLMFVISNRVASWALSHSAGTFEWSRNGLVRAVIILGVPAVVGYWVWIFDRSRFPDD